MAIHVTLNPLKLSKKDRALLSKLLDQEFQSKSAHADVDEAAVLEAAIQISDSKDNQTFDANPKLSRKQTYTLDVEEGEATKTYEIKLTRSLIQSAQDPNKFEVVEHNRVLTSEDKRNKQNAVLGKGAFGKVKHATTFLHRDANSQLKKGRETRVVKLQVIKRRGQSDEVWKEDLGNFMQLVRREEQLNQRMHGDECEKTIIRIKGSPDEDQSVQFFSYMPNMGLELKKLQDQGLIQQLNDKKLLLLCENIMKQMQKLEQAGIVHRDLKPDNILVNHKTLDARIIDFGLAKNADEHDQKPTGYGNYGFTSPERLNQQSTTYASDMYAILLVLQEMITGQPYHPLAIEIAKAMNERWKDQSVIPGDIGVIPPSINGFSETRKDLLKWIFSSLVQQPEQRPTAQDALEQIQKIRKSNRRARLLHLGKKTDTKQSELKDEQPTQTDTVISDSTESLRHSDTSGKDASDALGFFNVTKQVEKPQRRSKLQKLKLQREIKKIFKETDYYVEFESDERGNLTVTIGKDKSFNTYLMTGEDKLICIFALGREEYQPPVRTTFDNLDDLVAHYLPPAPTPSK